MLPTYLKTNDSLLAWQAGLAWAFVIGIIILCGAFVGPRVRKYTPRAAMLGALAGISIAFISMRPAFQSWQIPWLAFLSLAIIRAGRSRRRRSRCRSSLRPGVKTWRCASPIIWRNAT